MTTQIIDHLSKDPLLGAILSPGLISVTDAGSPDVYLALVRATVYQQLTGKAASTIYRRFLELFPEGYPQADQLVAMDTGLLRGVGLSRQKAAYIQNIAAFFLEERLLPSGDWWQALDDEALIRYLTRIKGVGQWTVEMLLIFTLNRPDVFPLDDLGIRQTIIRLYGLDPTLPAKPLRAGLIAIAEPWRPYRSYACRALWKWRDGENAFVP